MCDLLLEACCIIAHETRILHISGWDMTKIKDQSSAAVVWRLVLGRSDRSDVLEL